MKFSVKEFDTSQLPPLKSETVVAGDIEFDLFELTGFYRCQYLAETTGDTPLRADGEVPKTEIQTLGEMYEFHRTNVSDKLLLVAYALWMNPECTDPESVIPKIHSRLLRTITGEDVETLHVAAAKLSGLYFEPEAEKGSEEDSKKD